MQNKKPLLEVCLSPALLHLYDLKDTTVVVIDIFRATTTMCVAFAHGAHKIYPFLEIQDCLNFKAQHPNVISAGERNGQLIEGMDKGNSPSDYPFSFINNKEMALTTTNGTKVLHMSSEADEIIIGSFVNLNNITTYLKNKGQKVLLACAGWKDKVNMEDALFAGAVAYNLKNDFLMLCDTTKMSMQLWENTQEGKFLLETLKTSSHYNRLMQFGAEEDLQICTSLNTHPCLPIYHKEGFITNAIKQKI